MAITWQGNEEQFTEKVLLPGVAAYFQAAIRKRLAEVADQAVKEAQEELCAVVVKQITAIKHFEDRGIEIVVTIDNKSK